VRVIDTFEDGPALFDAILAHGLEGVVAKRERDPYRPAERALGEDQEPDDPTLCRGITDRRASHQA
jgi:hypothetical protein